ILISCARISLGWIRRWLTGVRSCKAPPLASPISPPIIRLGTCGRISGRRRRRSRPAGLFLDHRPPIAHPAAGAHVIDLQRDEIAAAQLAVDREVEQGEIALATLKLKPDPDRPDLLRLERAFLADQATTCSRASSESRQRSGS